VFTYGGLAVVKGVKHANSEGLVSHGHHFFRGPSTTVTETAYRHQIGPVIQTGALAMDRIFDDIAEREPY
jgi:ABC-type iron transport system FetAB ATPase subunit